MRIIAGKFKGQTLPSFSGADPSIRLRPTSDRTREGIFNVLSHNPYITIDGSRVLDLFAGTGALGLEALSRGARHVTFVEKHPDPATLIRASIEKLKVADQTVLYRRDVTALGANKSEPYNIVFLDPPYHENLAIPTLQSLATGNWLAPDCLIVLEFPTQMPPELQENTGEIVQHKKYGKSSVYFIKTVP
jgi:16S rRNA (guanine966-N2)-methyltransferase